MALARSNRGSWSTSFSSNSAIKVKPSGGVAIPMSVENDTVMAAKTAFLSKDNLGRLYSPGNSSQGLGFNNRMLMVSVQSWKFHGSSPNLFSMNFVPSHFAKHATCLNSC